MNDIQLTCAGCQSRLKAPGSAAGRRIRCPKCKTISTLPPLHNKSTSNESNGESNEARKDKQQTSTFELIDEQTTTAAARCRHCDAKVATGAVICISCGTNLVTGARYEAAAIETALESKGANAAGKHRAVASHSLTRGCIGCFLGTALGAAAWIAVALYTKHELAVMSILLGGLSGLGMYWGHRDVGLFAGLIAAIIALAGIVTARILVIQQLFNPDIGPIELVLAALFATGWWGIAFLGVSMFIAFKVGATGPDAFEDD